MSDSDTTDASDFMREVHQLLGQFDAIMNFCDRIIEIRRADRIECQEMFGPSVLRRPLVNEAAFWTISNEYSKLREIVKMVQSGINADFNSALMELREILARAKRSEKEL